MRLLRQPRVAVTRPGRLFTKNTGLCQGLKPTYTVRRVLDARMSRKRVMQGLRALEKLAT